MYIILLYIEYNIEERVQTLLNYWLKDLLYIDNVKVFINNTNTTIRRNVPMTYHKKKMEDETQAIIIDYIYTIDDDPLYNIIKYIHTNHKYDYLYIIKNPHWINTTKLLYKFNRLKADDSISFGDVKSSIYCNTIINTFIKSGRKNIYKYIKLSSDEKWSIAYNITTKQLLNEYIHIYSNNKLEVYTKYIEKMYNYIFISDKDFIICSSLSHKDMILSYKQFHKIRSYKFKYFIFIYDNKYETYLNLNNIYIILTYLEKYNIEYYYSELFYIISYYYLETNKYNTTDFNKNPLLIKDNHQTTLYEFYNIYNIYDYFDDKYIYDKYKIKDERTNQNIVSSITTIQKPYYKNILLLFTSKKTYNRVDILKKYWLKSNLLKDYKLIIVTGGNKITYMEKDNNFDILYTNCDDTYIKFPHKVYESIKYVYNYFKYDYVIKIDDDVYLNIDNLTKYIEECTYDYVGYELGKDRVDNRWHFGRTTLEYEFEWNEAQKGTYFNGPCYILSNKATSYISKSIHESYIKNHIYEDYAISNILYQYDIKRCAIEHFNLPNIYEMFEYNIDEKKNITDLKPYNSINHIISFHCGPFAGDGELYYYIDLDYIFNIVKTYQEEQQLEEEEQQLEEQQDQEQQLEQEEQLEEQQLEQEEQLEEQQDQEQQDKEEQEQQEQQLEQQDQEDQYKEEEKQQEEQNQEQQDQEEQLEEQQDQEQQEQNYTSFF